MADVRIFISAYMNEIGNHARYIPVRDVDVVSINMDMYGKPYMFFKHKDYPLGALKAYFDCHFWQCDLD